MVLAIVKNIQTTLKMFMMMMMMMICVQCTILEATTL